MKHWTGKVTLSLTADVYASNPASAKRLLQEQLARVLVPFGILARGYDQQLETVAALSVNEEES